MSDAEDVQFAVCSYRRAGVLAGKTWALLRSWGVLDRTRVYLSDPSEADAYTAALGSEAQIRPGAPGVGGNKNAVLTDYPVGTKVVTLDDDICDLAYASGGKLIPGTPEEVMSMIHEAFALAGRGLWGVYPVVNAYFMQPTVTHGLRFLIGQFTGQTIRREPILTSALAGIEDYERTVLHYLADGQVTRINWWCARTAGVYRGAGGIAEQRTIEKKREACERLIAAYPGIVLPAKARKSGMPEVRLARKVARP